MIPDPSEVFNIYSNLVYTSYFSLANKYVPDNRQISIAISTPEWFKGEWCSELCPPIELLDAYKNGLSDTPYSGRTITLEYMDTGINIDFIRGKLTQESYEKVYRALVLDKLDPQEIYRRFKGKVLCCWESGDKFCHRHIVFNWLRDNLGDEFVGWELGMIKGGYIKVLD